MITNTIKLKESSTDADYTKLCNLMEKQGVFKACGSCDDRWIMGVWEDELDYTAWALAMCGANPKEIK
jgi:hypothetical protein